MEPQSGHSDHSIRDTFKKQLEQDHQQFLRGVDEIAIASIQQQLIDLNRPPDPPLPKRLWRNLRNLFKPASPDHPLVKPASQVIIPELPSPSQSSHIIEATFTTVDDNSVEKNDDS